MLVITPRHIAKIGIVLCVLGALGYFAWRAYPAFKPPHLALSAPAQDLYVSSPELLLAGTTEPGARLTVNTENVYVDGSGSFAQTMRLASGLNVIEATAEGKFGRKTELTRYIIYVKS